MKSAVDKAKQSVLHGGFTLVELLVVIAIIGILVTIGLVSFRTSQIKGRDAQRKSDLRQLAASLELFYSDHGSYPASDVSGNIVACPYDASGSTACTWGDKDHAFSDGVTTYFRVIPGDPSGYNYFYVASNSNSEFKLYAHLENDQDPSYTVYSGVSCGGDCTFGISSTNTTP